MTSMRVTSRWRAQVSTATEVQNGGSTEATMARTEQTGQDLTEYALLLALLALGAITSIGTLAKMINNIFANAASNIGTATGP